MTNNNVLESAENIIRVQRDSSPFGTLDTNIRTSEQIKIYYDAAENSS